jgi:Tfp pilus assembly protein PilF
LTSNHVNVVLQRLHAAQRRTIRAEDADLVVDFLPGRDIAGARARTISEATLLAMFHNNRAAELLSTGQGDAAYWQARTAVAHDPAFAPALNTLGVVYQRAGLAGAAEASYRQVLAAEPHHKAALGNLASTLRQQGREAEAEPLERLLARLQPQPPFQAFDEGRRAMELQDFARARLLFDLELDRQPYQAEVHLWAARAHAQLGNGRQAAHHLAQARDLGSTPSERDRYSAKLEHLRRQLR